MDGMGMWVVEVGGIPYCGVVYLEAGGSSGDAHDGMWVVEVGNLSPTPSLPLPLPLTHIPSILLIPSFLPSSHPHLIPLGALEI